MERASPGEEPIRRIELDIDRPEFEELLARRQQIRDSGYGAPELERGWAAMFDMLLESLPETDPELAVAAYEAIATQGSDDLKSSIAVTVDLLFSVDREAMIRIATHLIRNESDAIGRATLEMLLLQADEGPLELEDIAPLVDVYLEVQEQRTADD